MKSEKMYKERKANISAFRGCGFAEGTASCGYCAFQNSLKRSPCKKCRTFEPHAHLECLNKRPPRTKEEEFITIGLTGDVSFASEDEMQAMFEYCMKWNDRTFMLQSKNPRCFYDYKWPENVILGTTIESNRTEYYDTDYWSYEYISGMPNVNQRFDAMYELSAKKVITIEPVLDFDAEPFVHAIIALNPLWVWIGYDSKPERNRLPEPPLEKTLAYIKSLENAGLTVRQKMIRKAWDEK